VADGSHAFGVFVRQDELGSAGHEPPASDMAPCVANAWQADRGRPSATNGRQRVSAGQPHNAHHCHQKAAERAALPLVLL